MKEVEAKILDVNTKALVDKILELGGKKIFEGTLKTIYFDKGDELDKNRQCLRIRNEGKQSILNFKYNSTKDKVKSADEIEFPIDNPKDMEKILNILGYDSKKPFTKTRTSYKLDKARLEFDTIDTLPTFLEIEAQDEQAILKICHKLGINKADLKSWSGKKVMKHYGREDLLQH